MFKTRMDHLTNDRLTYIALALSVVNFVMLLGVIWFK